MNVLKEELSLNRFKIKQYGAGFKTHKKTKYTDFTIKLQKISVVGK